SSCSAVPPAREERALRVPEATAEHEDQEEENAEVPERLVQERRMEEIFLRVHEGTVRRGDVELPGQGGGGTKGLLVEVVPPPADGLPQHQAGRDDIQVLAHRQLAQIRIAAAHQDAPDDPAVDGEAALPDRDDLPGELCVVVEVE